MPKRYSLSFHQRINLFSSMTAPHLLFYLTTCAGPECTCFADGYSRRTAEQEYLAQVPSKIVELHYIDVSRKSMYKELQKDYEKRLSWARLLGIGTEATFRFLLIISHQAR